jgi:hypothetical protein
LDSGNTDCVLELLEVEIQEFTDSNCRPH